MDHNLSELIYAAPKKSGNGFEAGVVYEFRSSPSSAIIDGRHQILEARNSNGHSRAVLRDTLISGHKCAHLGDANAWELISADLAVNYI